MRLFPRSTSTRTFVAIPAAVLVEQAVSRRTLRPNWAPLLAWGYLQYRLNGDYRIRWGGGPPGMSQGVPDCVVTSGGYAVVRHPMYLGHIIFLVGLTLTTRPPLALAATSALLPWFDERAERDEKRLVELFGDDYVQYAARVPRWLSALPQVRGAASGRG